MANYSYLDDDYLPVQTKNVIKEYWGFDTESKFVAKSLEFENACIGLVQSQINLTALLTQPRGEDVMSNLCSLYVGSKFFEQVSNNDYESYTTYLDNAFWNVLNAQKEAQLKLNIESDETETGTLIAGLEVF